MKNLPKDIVFLTDGYFDFDDGLWKSGRRNIRRVLRVPNSYKNILKYWYRLSIERLDEWFNEFSYYVNYPILNDRLAIVRGRLHNVTHMNHVT